jgi:predicted ATPase
MPSPSNLPQQLTSFIGRKREIAEVKRLLSTTRLLTLTGAGGCGKTRLALQVATRVQREYPDGVWFVDLAPLAESGLVPQALASALGVREQPGRDLMETLSDYLKPLKLLLVLDNCEHQVSACASLAGTLLLTCRDLYILATSRQMLVIAGEAALRVPSLSMPGLNQQLPLKSLVQHEAVQLFVDRALPKRPGFSITPENAPAVTQLCNQLDGIPLAIELGAAWMSVLTVEEIVERLHKRFRLLTLGNRAALPRQQTLLATMDWSYDLLSEAERALLRSLSVFAGGFTLEAVEAIWGGEADEYEMLALLSQLADKSLVIMDEHGGKSRYRLLETIRQYGLEKLSASGEMAELRNRHSRWYLALAEMAESQLMGALQMAVSLGHFGQIAVFGAKGDNI